MAKSTVTLIEYGNRYVYKNVPSTLIKAHPGQGTLEFKTEKGERVLTTLHYLIVEHVTEDPTP